MAIGFGSMALVSTVVHLPFLRGLGVVALEMKANTAVGFVLGGTAVLCALRCDRHSQRVSRVLGSLLLLLGAVTLFQIIFHVDLGIDEWLVTDESARMIGALPGRMVPASSVNCILNGAALMLLGWKNRHGKYPGPWLALVSGLSPLQVLIAYSHGVAPMLNVGEWPLLTQMAPHTAVAWLSLTLGILCASPSQGVIAPLFSESYSSIPFRRIMLLALILPMLLAWIATWAGTWKVYHPGFGGSVFTLLITILLMSFVWRNYRALLEFEAVLERKTETLQKSEKLLTSALGTRDEFISIASHELKTPLTSLKLQLQVAARNLIAGTPSDPRSEKMRKLLASAVTQVDRMTTLINDMLDLSTIRSGRLQYSLRPVNLAMVVRSTVDRFSHQLLMAECLLNLDVDSPVMVMGDAHRVEQVLANLLTNACKYAPGGQVWVSLKRHEGKAARLQVRDSGPGIPTSQRSLIFERFERAGAGGQIAGLGLGLYICRKITEAHGGKIWVESEYGKGSAFIVELPMPEGTLTP